MSRVMQLPDGETDPRKRYVMPDPDTLDDALMRARERVYAGLVVSPEDIKDLVSLAEGYLDLTTYDLGQEVCVGKLRDIWRARRRRCS